MGFTGEQFAEVVEPQGAGAQSLLQLEQIPLVPGGIPLFDGQVVIGAFAVGGATTEQDVECAQRALSKAFGGA